MADVTVLITVYNGMPHLEAAVKSILRQTMQDFRMVIVNDGSTDGTLDYLMSLNDERITIVSQANQGTAAAANHGLTLCDTEFTARMDADDVALPERLQRQRDFLAAHPEVGLAGTQVAPLGDARCGPSLCLPTEHDDIDRELLSGRHAIAHSSIMLRTRLLKRIGGYWSEPLVDDWDMMLRMGEVADLANVDEVLHHYRIHSGSLNGANMRRMRESIEFACELARLRRNGEPAQSYAEFAAARAPAPWWQRAAEAVDIHSRCQYRHALADLYGSRPWKGYARLAWSALCAPHLTCRRLARIVHCHVARAHIALSP